MFHHGMRARESDERRGEAETFISFECFETMMKHVELMFHMTSQTRKQTGEYLFY